MSKPAYLLVGDTHGSLDVAKKAISRAVEHSVRTIIQVGDWGYFWPNDNRVDELNALLARSNVYMDFIDGNHDDHRQLAAYAPCGGPHSHLSYMPRGSCMNTEADVEVNFLGGAASIDQERLTEGVSWWPEEEISENDLVNLHTCDVLLTHEAPIVPPGLPPWPHRISPLVQNKLDRSRAQIRRAVEICKPRRLYHGHYHFHYVSRFNDVEVIGLTADGERGSMLLVDEQFDPIKLV